MLKFTILIPLFNLIPFILSSNKLFRFKSTKGNLFSLYLSLNAVFGIICFIYALLGKNNHWCYNCLQIAIFINLILIFNVEYKLKFFLFTATILTIILVANTYTQDFYKFNQINFNIIFTIIGLLSGFQIKNLILNSDDFNFNKYEFWMYSGFFIFSFSAIFPNLFFSVESHKKSYFLFVFYYIYQVLLHLIVNLFFAKSVILIKKNEK
jgi:hypothetical protein